MASPPPMSAHRVVSSVAKAPFWRAAARPALLALLLSGCGGSSSDDADSPPPTDPPTDGSNAPVDSPGEAIDPSLVARPGQDVDNGQGERSGATPLHGRMRVSEVVMDGQPVASDVSARFVALTGDAPLADDALLRSDDVCVPAAASGAALLPDVASRIAGSVDAGTAVVLTGPDGTWATLVRSDDDADASAYLDDSTATGRIDGRIPSGLTLDITDDGAFPALSAIALPDPQPTGGTFTPPVGSSIDGDTTFRWSPSEATGSRLRITLGIGERSIECIVLDDGDFGAPQALVETDETASVTAVAREAIRIERRDNATLKLTVATDSP